MRYVKDIMDVKRDIMERILEVKIHGNNILLCDRYSGEAVKIGEVQPGKCSIGS